jgi:DNA-binding transcriptional regulator/RsmH inhibitor MraZ
LRDKSKISGDVILVGLGDRVEIWAKSAWEEFNKYPDVYGRERREGFENAYLLMTGQGG